MAKVKRNVSVALGITLILLGGLFLLARLDWLDLHGFWPYLWPVGLILFGAWQWARQRFCPCLWPPLLMALGVFFLARRLGWLEGFSFGLFAGIALILWGLGVLLRPRSTRRPPAEPDVDATDAGEATDKQ